LCVPQGGFSVILAAILCNTEIPLQLRQFGGILLRQLVEKHWDPSDVEETEETEDVANEEEDKEEFEISDEDKARVREMIPSVLNCPDSKIRTAASMVSAIAAFGLTCRFASVCFREPDALSINFLLSAGHRRDCQARLSGQLAAASARYHRCNWQ
jgi:hypothetical protein